MELSDVFTSNTLKASDLQGKEPVVTIETVTRKDFDNGAKLVVTFTGKKKALVCNKTNAQRIAMAHSTNTDNWIGKQIQLYTDIVDFQGKPVEAIRIRPLKGQPRPANQITSGAALQQAAQDPPFNDSLEDTF